MARYYLEITCLARDLTRDELEVRFEPLADAVYDLSDVIDADLGVDLDRRTFDFTMAVDADDEPSALAAGLAAVRCAVHAAELSTPGWEKHLETIQQLVRREPALADA